jgi:hypothetical protein
MVGRNPCRPIRAIADVSCERGMEMAVQEHADHLLILVHGLNARLACISSNGNYAICDFCNCFSSYSSLSNCASVILVSIALRR